MVKTGKTLKMTVGWRDGRKWRSWIDSIVGATERRFMRVKTKQLFKNLITIIWEFRASVRWVASVSGNTYTTQIIMSCFSKCGCKSMLRNKNEGNRHSTAGVTNQRNPTLLVNISHRRRASGNITHITVITQTCYLGVEECEGMNELSGSHIAALHLRGPDCDSQITTMSSLHTFSASERTLSPVSRLCP